MLFGKNTGSLLVALLLGLFPAFALPTLQGILWIVIITVALSFRQIDRALFQNVLRFRNFAFAQFVIFFLLNAAIFDVLEGGRVHYRAVALENWSLTLVCLVLLAIWLQLSLAEDVKRVLIRWLPVGLTLSFLVATGVYFFGNQGARIAVFATSPLGPPLWFLVLTMCSFAWFSEMNRTQKIWRLALLVMAGLMVVYASARLVVIAWVITGMALAIWLYLRAEPHHKKQALLKIILSTALAIGGVMLVNSLTVGSLGARMAVFTNVEFTYDSISAKFVRLKIWDGALTIVRENLWFGIGQVNERFAIRQELEGERWLYAHQTYLSYLIAGGIPALISGLIMQSPVLAFLKSAKRSTMLPAFLGLGVVVTMNCFTDSIFQSAVNVQVFMAATLIFLRASDADQPTFAPQKHVSSAII